MLEMIAVNFLLDMVWLQLCEVGRQWRLKLQVQAAARVPRARPGTEAYGQWNGKPRPHQCELPYSTVLYD